MNTTNHKNLFVCKASAGTGKTYTLAAHYVALLMNRVSYKQILAVTFTNKATAEMKERIISYLQDIAVSTSAAATRGFLRRVREVSAERGYPALTDEQYAQRAKTLVRDILSDFDNMRITTIDSFLQTLLTGLAQALGQAAGFAVDLDVNHAIAEAVDHVLAEDVQEKAIRDAVVKCLKERLLTEEKWDLRPALIRMVKELYREDVQMLRQHIIIPSADHPGYQKQLEDFRALLGAFQQDRAYTDFLTAFAKIESFEDGLAQSTGSRNYLAFYRRCRELRSLTAVELKPLGKTDYQRFLRPETFQTALSPDEVQVLATEVAHINECMRLIKPAYVAWRVRKQYLRDLELVGYVLDRVRRTQRENNTVLLAETANTLCRALKEHDAEFVLLKAGIHYRHIMLDEFQDTSTLQWSNFRPLIEEMVSQEGGSALIVGDVKQSIYRWRNGDYEIMVGLDKPESEPVLHYHYHPQSLVRNFRSRQEVVRFNLHTFKSLAEKEAATNPVVAEMYKEGADGFMPDGRDNLSDFCSAGKPGGYVCLRAFRPEANTTEANNAAKYELLTYMFTRMEELLAAGYKKKDMLILCRTAAEGRSVLACFRQLITDASRFPHLHAAGQIVSGDSFILGTSSSVMTIISGLRMLALHDDVARRYLQSNLPRLDMDALCALDVHVPLSDLVEQITRICLCADDGVYPGEDIAYLNCFRDKLRTYIAGYGSNLTDFLTYWEDKMHADAVPAIKSDDIHIMTIHSSKGLEAKNVFLPFCAWKMTETGKNASVLWVEEKRLHLDAPLQDEPARLPVKFGQQMTDAGLAEEYEREQKKEHIDALNLLYVACTRAEDNLIIPFNAESGTVGSLLCGLYGDTYEVGQPCQPEAEHEKADGPFSFEHAEAKQATYRSTDAQVCFRQSMQSRELMQQVSGAEPNQENREFGNLCHAILERVRTGADVEQAVNDFAFSGQIANESDKKHILSLLNRLMSHPVAADWFSGSWTLLREDTVLCLDKGQVQESRMDRVMLRDGEAVVLDYKFGTMKPEYTEQVRRYMSLMRQMGYSRVRGYLWLGFTAELIEIE